MSHYVKKYYNHPTAPNNLLVFLHGYNGHIEDIESQMRYFDQNLQNTLILTPESTEVCEKNPQKKQWYSLRRFDPDDQRRNPALSLGQLTEIYRHYGPLIRPVADDLNNLIDSVQRETGILDSNTAVAGFSQGAMLACFTALTRRGFDGKCLMFAGVVAGADELEKEVRSAPKTYLFHGQDDTSVNFKTMEFSKNWLTDHLIETKAQSYAELAHRMREDELADAVKILKGA